MRETIHARATASSLGLLRVLVFGIWAAIPVLERVPLLSDLPSTAFAPPGVMGLLPDAIQAALISAPSLWVITGSMVMMSVVVAIGAYPRMWFTILTVAIVLLEQGIVRGYSGHVNHAELALVYVSVALLVFPIYDGLSLRRPPKTGSSRSQYRAAFLVVMLIFTMSYAFVGAARLSEGVSIFQSDTLVNILLGRQARVVDITGEVVMDLPWYMEPRFLFIPRVAYALTTVGELLSPVALVRRSTRLLFVGFALSFHLVNLFWLGVTFYENLILLVAFSERWFHQLAQWLDHKLLKTISDPHSVTL